ncbi:MAG: hypothetical protein MJZ58_06445 [Paludibacteraceae bacterium]|nr:hypothetical protein [Paludibacteraceae bacterium]
MEETAKLPVGSFSAKVFCRFFSGGIGGFGGLAELMVCNYLIVSRLHSNHQTANSAKGISKNNHRNPKAAMGESLTIS